MANQTAATGAESVRWRLDLLYKGVDDPTLEQHMQAGHQRAAALRQRYHGEVRGLSAAQVAEMITAFEAAIAIAQRPNQYAELLFTTASDDPAVGRLLARTREQIARFEQETVFIKLELAALPHEHFEMLLAAPELADYQHWLELIDLERDHLLSEAEERILSEKAITGRQAWVRLFDETYANLRMVLDGQPVGMEEVLSLLHDADRTRREKGWRVMTEGLRTKLPLSAYIFNQILADKASEDRLRGYDSWVRSRNIANEVDDESVQALIDAVTSRYDIVQRYYTLKRDLLNIDELYDYDRYAPLPAIESSYSWDAARDIVLSSFAAFDTRIHDAAARFFDEGWIDAATYPGKQGGAYCSDTVDDLAHPFIFMSYQGKFSDVQTLAHELGHGMHAVFAAPQGVLQADTPMTTAETASTFAEMLVFQNLLAQESDPQVRLAMLADKLEGSFSTISRQISLNRFEDAIHTARREQGELNTSQFNALWLKSQREMFGDSVTITDEYGLWWSYIWHFVGAPGYVYAYAFGELLVLALYARYQAEPEGFADKYIAALAAGGSDWPHTIMADLGVDLTDPAFWHEGLDILEAMVAEAETLA